MLDLLLCILPLECCTKYRATLNLRTQQHTQEFRAVSPMHKLEHRVVQWLNGFEFAMEGLLKLSLSGLTQIGSDVDILKRQT